MSGLRAGQPCTRTVFLWRYIFFVFAQRGLMLSVIPAVSSNTPEVHGLWKTVAIHLRQAQAQRCWQTLWMLVIYGFHFGQVLTCIFCRFSDQLWLLPRDVCSEDRCDNISSSRNIMHLWLYGRARRQLCLKWILYFFYWNFVVCMVSVFSAAIEKHLKSFLFLSK